MQRELWGLPRESPDCSSVPRTTLTCAVDRGNLALVGHLRQGVALPTGPALQSPPLLLWKGRGGMTRGGLGAVPPPPAPPGLLHDLLLHKTACG